MKEKKTIIFCIFVITLLFLSTSIYPTKAKNLLQKKEKRKDTENYEATQENQQQNPKFIDKIKNNSFLTSYTLPAIFFTAILLSFLFDIGLIEVIIAGISGFVFGLATWPIVGPFFVISSPFLGFQAAVESNSIIAGLSTTIFSIIVGITLPLSMSLISSMAMFSLAIEPAPIWWY